MLASRCCGFGILGACAAPSPPGSNTSRKDRFRSALDSSTYIAKTRLVWKDPKLFGRKVQFVGTCFLDEQDRNGRFVADFMDGAAENDVTQEPMTVGSHRDQVTLFICSNFQDFSGRIPHGKLNGDLQTR